MKTPTSADVTARPSTAFSQADSSSAVSPAGTSPSAVSYDRVPRPSILDGRPQQPNQPSMRRYEVACLDLKGGILTSTHIAPAIPLFEAAVSAFARGTLISTPSGEVAIEDLVPGDMVMTLEGNAAPIQWIGATTYMPERMAKHDRTIHMTRIVADAFGMSRPSSYLMAGPAARILHTPDQLRAAAGTSKMLTPVRSFVDGENVIDVAPPAPVRLFHLCLQHHAVIFAGGLEVETYHPGAGATHAVSHNLRHIYLSMFEHIHHVAEFGPMAFPHAPDDIFADVTAA